MRSGEHSNDEEVVHQKSISPNDGGSHRGAKSNGSFRAKLLADIKRKDLEAKNKAEIELNTKKHMQERAHSYAKYVKEMYRPKKVMEDYDAQNELSVLTNKNPGLPPLPSVRRVGGDS